MRRHLSVPERVHMYPQDCDLSIPFKEELPRLFFPSTCFSLPGIFVRDANACALPEESFRLKRLCLGCGVALRYRFCGWERVEDPEQGTVSTFQVIDIHGCTIRPAADVLSPAKHLVSRAKPDLRWIANCYLSCYRVCGP